MTAYRAHLQSVPAIEGPASWWRRIFLGWLDALLAARRRRRSRAQAAEACAARLVELRRRREEAWWRWYVRSSYITDEACAVRREYLRLVADVERARAEASS